MSVYGLLVQKRRDERAKRERGLSPRALSRLTRTVDDRRAWDEAYRAALWIGVQRDGWNVVPGAPFVDTYSVRVDRMSA